MGSKRLTVNTKLLRTREERIRTLRPLAQSHLHQTGCPRRRCRRLCLSYWRWLRLRRWQPRKAQLDGSMEGQVYDKLITPC